MSMNDSSPRSSPAVFVTDHLSLAGYLITCGHDPTLRASGSGTILFKFAASDDLTTAVDAFNNGCATVEPTSYDSARIRLRRRMDALKGGAR